MCNIEHDTSLWVQWPVVATEELDNEAAAVAVVAPEPEMSLSDPAEAVIAAVEMAKAAITPCLCEYRVRQSMSLSFESLYEADMSNEVFETTPVITALSVPINEEIAISGSG